MRLEAVLLRDRPEGGSGGGKGTREPHVQKEMRRKSEDQKMLRGNEARSKGYGGERVPDSTLYSAVSIDVCL